MGTVQRFFSVQEYAYHYIKSSKKDLLLELITQHPEVISKPLTQDCGSPALNVAVRQENIQVLELLVRKGATPDFTDKFGRDAWMVAAYYDCGKAINFLEIKFGEPQNRKSKSGFNALDYAILRCCKQIAVKLLNYFPAQDIKEAKVYADFAARNRIRYINYQLLINCLLNHGSQSDFCDYFKRPLAVFKEPVIDTREGWINFIRRVAEMQPPPVVQKQQLSVEMRPQNRRLGWLYQKLSGIERVRRENEYNKEVSSSEFMSEMSL